MAFWVLGGGANPLHTPVDDDVATGCSYFSSRRTTSASPHGHVEALSAPESRELYQQMGMVPWRGFDSPDTSVDLENRSHSRQQRPDSIPVRNLSFLVIREGRGQHCSSPSPSPSPEPPIVSSTAALISPVPSSDAIRHNDCPPPGFAHGLGSASAPPCLPMERTESGLPMTSASSPHDALSSLINDDHDDIATGLVFTDLAAAHFVRNHLASFRRRCADSQSERILRSLISPKSRGADFPLDNDALGSIFSAANDLFFASRLSQRVAWDWSHPECGQYESHIVGTTALRRCARLGGWETLIVLSSPILRDTKYNRRLLISTFLHEMIHSFMFVMCGLKAGHDGGHTEGFRQIAAMIDEWVGRDFLRLSDMEANLERFRGGTDFPRQTHCSRAAFPHAPHPLQDQHNEGISAHRGGDSTDGNGMDVVDPREWSRAQPGIQHHQHHHHAAVTSPYSSHTRGDWSGGDWQWYGQEDFGARTTHTSDPPYVY